MKFVIETARHQHLVKDEAALRAKHAAFIAKLSSRGHSARLHNSDAPLETYVNHGKWVALCDCGAGVATDPDFTAAYCHGCGAIHTNVVFPSDRLEVERLLLARPKSENRNWVVGETADALLTDNDDHGVTR